MRTVIELKTLLTELICIPLNFHLFHSIIETCEMKMNSSEGEFGKDRMLIKFRKRRNFLSLTV